MNLKQLVHAVESSLGRELVEDDIKWISDSMEADPKFSERLLQRLSQRKSL
jgi:hypothetical protein